MAASFFTCDSPAIAVTAATPLTVVMVTAATNQAIRIKELLVTFDGATSTAVPPKIEYGRPSSSGTFTSVTLRKRDPDRTGTLQSTGGKNASAEPTWTSVIDGTMYEPAYGGVYQYLVPDSNPIIVIAAGRYGIRVTPAANVNCSSRIEAEE